MAKTNKEEVVAPETAPEQVAETTTPEVSETPETASAEPVVEEQNGVVCKVCGKEYKKSYDLAKHEAKVHADSNEGTMADIELEGPQMQLLRFTKPVKFNINGKQYTAELNGEAYEVEVEYDRVPSAMDTVLNAYGRDVLAV